MWYRWSRFSARALHLIAAAGASEGLNSELSGLELSLGTTSSKGSYRD